MDISYWPRTFARWKQWIFFRRICRPAKPAPNLLVISTMLLLVFVGSIHNTIYLFVLFEFFIVSRIDISVVDFSCLINFHFFFVINFFYGKFYSSDFQDVTLLNIVLLLKFVVKIIGITILLLWCLRLLTTKYICSFRSLLSTFTYGLVQLSK